MKKITICLMLTQLAACSSTQIDQIEGVERVKLSQNNYEKPQFYIKKYKPAKATRSIASVETEEDDKFEGSAKKVYFFTLWQEYKAFNTITNTHNDINSCPQFHHDIITQDSYSSNNQNFYNFNAQYDLVKMDPKQIVHYPVLSLPYKGADLYSYLVSKNAWKDSSYHTLKAMQEHNQKNKEEIIKLCDTGTSPGYYIYENMVTYYQNNEDFQRSYDALPSILKVNTISNMLILDSMVKPEYKISHIDGYKTSLLEKLKVSWFKNYLYEVNLIRNNKKDRFVLKD